MFGLGLMLLSLPLSHQAELTYTNLMYRCDVAESTHRLYQYATVLQSIRVRPSCVTKNSVEECDGYEDAAPFTEILKGMESSFRCAGFCYTGGCTPAVSTLSLKQKIKKRYSNQITKLGGDAKLTPCDGVPCQSQTKATPPCQQQTAEGVRMNSNYAPTLFSTSNYQASCEGMAARDMKNFAGSIGQQTFLQGLALVLIAVVTGFLKLLSFCMTPRNPQGVTHDFLQDFASFAPNAYVEKEGSNRQWGAK